MLKRTSRSISDYFSARGAKVTPYDLKLDFGVDDATAWGLYDAAGGAFGPGGRGLAWFERKVAALLKKLPKPRRGKCFIYHGEAWSSSASSEWEPSQYLRRHGREVYVGERVVHGKNCDVWLAYPAGESAPLPLFIAQVSRGKRR